MPHQTGLNRVRSKQPPRGWIKKRRVTAYQAPPRSRFRRFLAFFASPWLVGSVLILVLGGFLITFYYWSEFSDRIDRRLLSGEVYTPTAGIYSAPKTLKVGDETSMTALIDYLKTAGYIERNNQADASRSRYVVENGILGIEPGATGTVDGQKAFHALSIKFSKDQKSVAGIGDRDTNAQVNEAKLEPK